MKEQRMDRDDLPLDRRLRQEILHARERVYRFGQATPMERLVLPGNEPGPEIWVKREVLQRHGEGHRSCKPVDAETLARMTA